MRMGIAVAHATSPPSVAAVEKTAQPYIACFEMLAQLALAMMAHALRRNTMWTFLLPAASDNAPTEAGINKIWSMTAHRPISPFLKLAAQWSSIHNVEMMITYVAGKANTWADELSRGQHPRFAARMHERHFFPLQSPLMARHAHTSAKPALKKKQRSALQPSRLRQVARV